MFGGLTGVPRDWTTNPTVFRYGADGRSRGSLELPLPDGRFLFSSASYVDDDELVIVGNTCVTPSSENGGCNSPVVPVALAVSRDEARLLTLPAGWDEERGENPGDGMVYVRGEGGDGSALLTRVTGDGPVPNLTHTFDAALADLASGASRPVQPADGALTPDSVCTRDRWIYTLIPVLDETLRLTSVQVLRQSADGGLPELFAEVDSFVSEAVVGGRIHCLAHALVLQADASPAELVVIDAEDGEQVGDALQIPAPVSSTWISPDGDRLILSAMGSTASEDGTATDTGHTASYYEVTRESGVRHVGSAPKRQGELTYAVAIDDDVVDVAYWGRDPASAEAPQPIG